MTDILHIVEKYKSYDGSPLSHPAIVQDITLIQNAMPTASAEEKQQATEFLKPLMGDIEIQINEMAKELDGKAEAMEKLQKTADACIAYLKPKGSKG